MLIFLCLNIVSFDEIFTGGALARIPDRRSRFAAIMSAARKN
jgi:hypothetical protein